MTQAEPQNPTHNICRVAAVAAVLGYLFGIGNAQAQEMEPRAYSALPLGANFLVAGYTHTTGNVSLDPSLPISDVRTRIDAFSLAYQRTFGLFGRSSSILVALPYVRGEIRGQLEDQSRYVLRSGPGDMRLRFATNLSGSPALTPQAFARRKPTSSFGASLTVVAPTGEYDPSRLINIGSNRWAFKPEIGISRPIGRWFTEASAGVWLFTKNDDFFLDRVRGADPIWTLQLHAGYQFRPNLWVAANGTYYRGGATSIDGVARNDRQAVSRIGLTFSFPLSDSISAKVLGTTWTTAHGAGSYHTFGISLQYRWLDH